MMIKRIVIVDDHQLVLDGLQALFAKCSDIDVILATKDIQKALRVIREEKPQLIITDISMPEMSGIEFISILKKQHPKLKIMVLSMFESLQSYKDIDAYLLKETGYDELIKAIRDVVDHGKKHLHIVEKKENNIQFYKNLFLTVKEKEIVQLIIKEYTTGEIAMKLNNTANTIMSHRKNIFLKLEVTNIAGLTKKAIQLGLI